MSPIVVRPPASYPLRRFIYQRKPVLTARAPGAHGKVTKMKFNIDELSYEEIKDVVDRLRAMKIESKFSRLGSSIVLQTEQGPMVVARNEAVELFGIPAVF